MAQLDCCDRCEFCAHSAYLVCAAHPHGVEGNHCTDFKLAITGIDEQLAWYGDGWQPDGASYYGNELILDPVQRLTLEQRLALMDTHPLFTGRCPRCERPIVRSHSEQPEFDRDEISKALLNKGFKNPGCTKHCQQ